MEPSIYSGTLLIKTTSALTRRWTERHAILRKSLLEWHTKKVGGNLTHAGQVSLEGSSLVDAPGKYPFAFELILKDGQALPFRTNSAAAAAAWAAAFHRTVTRMLVADIPGATASSSENFKPGPSSPSPPLPLTQETFRCLPFLLRL